MPLRYKAFRKIIETHHRFLITTHVNPDGDGLGSEVALALFLQKLGKQVTILNYSPTPKNYLFLDDLFPILHFQVSIHTRLIADAESIIVVDTNNLDRTVAMKPYIRKCRGTIICIDHHLDPSDFAQLNIIDGPSAATGEIVYRLISHLHKWPIDRETAIALYTAIMTDTGSFRYSRTDSEVHRIVAHLIQHGVNPVEIHENIYERGSIQRLQLLGMALANIQLAHNDKVAYMIITRHMFEVTNTAEADTDTFVPNIFSIDGVRIALMFTELENCIKVNFRSKGDIWINQLAKKFGGNGHKNAAGAQITGAVLEKIVSQIVDYSGAYVP